MLRKPFPFFLGLIFILALSTFSMALAVDQAPGDSEQSDSFQIQSPASFWPGQDGFGYLGSTPTYAWVEISRGTAGIGRAFARSTGEVAMGSGTRTKAKV